MDNQQAARQNFRVWARRLNIDVDHQLVYSELDKHFPGSVLVGPLTLAFSIYLKDEIENRVHRRTAAIGAGKTLAAALRGENDSNLLAELAKHMPPNELAMYSPIVLKAVSNALAARSHEKSQPNITNAILGRLRG